MGFSGGLVIESPPINAGDTGSVPGQGIFHMPWSNEAHAPPLLKPTSPRVCALQQEKAPQ